MLMGGFFTLCYSVRIISPETIQSACNGYRFGPFEVWPRKGLLMRDGRRIRIEELPFQLLLILLESPGEVVSKETLRSRLWSDRAFGEFDSSLHVAAAKLREALGKKAGAAQYIETIRRRGYSFTGKVEPIFSPASGTVDIISTEVGAAPSIALPGSFDLPIAPLPEQEAPQESKQDHWKVNIFRLRPVLIGGFSLTLLLLIAYGALLFYLRRQSPLTGDSGEVVLGGFTNNSGDDSYSGLGRIFRVKLEESPFLNLISDQSLQRLVPTLASAPLEQLLKGCASLGGKVLITGAITAKRPGYEIAIAARNCANGNLITSQKVRAASRETILAALDEAAGQVRKSLGESKISLQKFNMPLAQATTSSPAALRAFTLGEEKRANGHEFEAIPDYKLAVDLDPQFALAYARLGTI
ncbi:MAG TPA: winged helix-turn-helix domain-containing protein, partial [Alloacidobacterium sp.]|nr:winged helix-turn-helix domain-containing protein [Alloacidobacterium sp.]